LKAPPAGELKGREGQRVRDGWVEGERESEWDEDIEEREAHSRNKHVAVVLYIHRADTQFERRARGAR
jgi:hypothetical protein